MYPSLPWSFLGLGRSESSFEKARFIVIPVPYDSTASYRPGSREGPHHIIAASRHMELFDVELEEEPYTKGVFTLDEMETVRGSPAETLERVYLTVKNVIQQNKTPILIGGEHTITLGAAKALPSDSMVVDLDAHADLRNECEGDSLSHACVMRRILELGRGVVEIGVRSMSEEEYRYARRENIPIVYREAIRRRGLEETLKDIRRIIEGRRTYLSIDIDVFDPSEAPSAATPEPDGLRFWEVSQIMKEVCGSSRVMGVDLMEVTPIAGDVITEFLAAKVLYKAIGYIRQLPIDL